MLFKQIGTSPLFIWGGLLTLILSVTNMAIQKLTSPGPIELAEIAASPVQSEAAEISPQTDEALPALPLWLFGAIAIGCASGSWLISQQINLIAMPANRMGAMGTRPFPGQVRRPPRLTKSRATLAQQEATESGRILSRMERSRSAEVTRVPQQTRRSQAPLAPEVSRATIRRRCLLGSTFPGDIEAHMTGQLQQALRIHGPQKEEVQMSSTWPPKQRRNVVVPELENLKSDRALGGDGKRGEKNLAEMMDIRKGQSLASVVRNIALLNNVRYSESIDITGFHRWMLYLMTMRNAVYNC